ncbi:MAG: O-antigen ligase family protein [Deltaproteobacteria bacterium]|nr:O-antigen ligase family protein [Deltaproteobacteria bacterium]
MEGFSKLESRDRLAYAGVVAFAVALYSSIVNLFPFLGPLRPALTTAALAAMLVVFARVARGMSFTWDGWRGLCLLSLGVWAMVSTSWSFNPQVSRGNGLELLKLIAIYLTIVNLVNTPRRLAWIAFAAVLASLAPSIGTVDYWRREVNLIDGYRAHWLGVYLDPNHLAMSLVAIVPVAFAFAISRDRASWMRVVGGLAGGLGIAAIILAHSRGGALGLALALGLWAVSGGRKLRSGLAAAVALLGIAVFAPRSFWSRTESITEYGVDLSAQGRVWAWEVTAAINHDRPLTGVGAGAFVHAWPSYARGEARTARFVAHNIFLAEIGELGFVGFFLFLSFVSGTLGGGVRAWKHPEVGALARALTAGFAGYIRCDMLSGYVLSAHFFFLTALSAAADRIARTAPEEAAFLSSDASSRPSPSPIS